MIDQWGPDTPLTGDEIDDLLITIRECGRAWFSPMTTALLADKGFVEVIKGASVLTEAGRARIEQGARNDERL